MLYNEVCVNNMCEIELLLFLNIKIIESQYVALKF